MVIWDNVVNKSPENVDHGARGYYFGENGVHAWYDIAKAIGRAMVDLGLSESDEPTPFAVEELSKYFGSEVAFRSDATSVKLMICVLVGSGMELRF